MLRKYKQALCDLGYPTKIIQQPETIMCQSLALSQTKSLESSPVLPSSMKGILNLDYLAIHYFP